MKKGCCSYCQCHKAPESNIGQGDGFTNEKGVYYS